MSVALEAREPSARNFDAVQPALLHRFDLLATPIDGAARLRRLILTLTVQGKLVAQDPGGEPASALIEQIIREKSKLEVDGKAKRGKPRRVVTEDVPPHEIPASWDWVRLGSVVKISTGKLDANAACSAGQFPFFTCSNTPLSIDTYSFDCSAVLLAGNGDFNLKMYRGKFDAYQRTYVIEPCLIDLHFLYYSLMHSVGGISSSHRGTAVPYLRLGDITESMFALPPLAEQARIVARVDELMRLCDALEAKGQIQAAQHAQLLSTLLGTLTDSASPAGLAENWQRLAAHFDLLLDRPEAVDTLEQTVLQLAVRGLLVPQDAEDESANLLLQATRTETDRLIGQVKGKRVTPESPIVEGSQSFSLPASWVWVSLDEVSKVISGHAFSSQDFSSESGFRTIKIANAGVGEFHETDDYLPASFENGFENFQAVSGDLIIALTRPYVSGGLKISKCPASYDGALINQRVAAIRCYPGISNDFVFTYLQTADVLGIFKNRFNESGLQPNLKVSDITELAIPLPPLAEQARIVARVEELRRLCAALRQRLTASQTTQSHLADALVEQAAA